MLCSYDPSSYQQNCEHETLQRACLAACQPSCENQCPISMKRNLCQRVCSSACISSCQNTQLVPKATTASLNCPFRCLPQCDLNCLQKSDGQAVPAAVGTKISCSPSCQPRCEPECTQCIPACQPFCTQECLNLHCMAECQPLCTPQCILAHCPQLCQPLCSSQCIAAQCVPECQPLCAPECIANYCPESCRPTCKADCIMQQYDAFGKKDKKLNNSSECFDSLKKEWDNNGLSKDFENCWEKCTTSNNSQVVSDDFGTCSEVCDHKYFKQMQAEKTYQISVPEELESINSSSNAASLGFEQEINEQGSYIYAPCFSKCKSDCEGYCLNSTAENIKNGNIFCTGICEDQCQFYCDGNPRYFSENLCIENCMPQCGPQCIFKMEPEIFQYQCIPSDFLHCTPNCNDSLNISLCDCSFRCMPDCRPECIYGSTDHQNSQEAPKSNKMATILLRYDQDSSYLSSNVSPAFELQEQGTGNCSGLLIPNCSNSCIDRFSDCFGPCLYECIGSETMNSQWNSCQRPCLVHCSSTCGDQIKNEQWNWNCLPFCAEQTADTPSVKICSLKLESPENANRNYYQSLLPPSRSSCVSPYLRSDVSCVTQRQFQNPINVGTDLNLVSRKSSTKEPHMLNPCGINADSAAWIPSNDRHSEQRKFKTFSSCNTTRVFPGQCCNCQTSSSVSSVTCGKSSGTCESEALPTPLFNDSCINLGPETLQQIGKAVLSECLPVCMPMCLQLCNQWFENNSKPPSTCNSNSDSFSYPSSSNSRASFTPFDCPYVNCLPKCTSQCVQRELQACPLPCRPNCYSKCIRRYILEELKKERQCAGAGKLEGENLSDYNAKDGLDHSRDYESVPYYDDYSLGDQEFDFENYGSAEAASTGNQEASESGTHLSESANTTQKSVPSQITEADPGVTITTPEMILVEISTAAGKIATSDSDSVRFIMSQKYGLN
ncbi:unnamed protein product [Enterobius vermicularis]|uniref:Cysteine rich repeat-containing domain protein n=1 Tax=Enterobius vermicularis TaxID=51028 RepID=A0A0N4UUW7_ENTVE|nr:unnamed protein product [Enterobius vermicularis]